MLASIRNRNGQGNMAATSIMAGTESASELVGFHNLQDRTAPLPGSGRPTAAAPIRWGGLDGPEGEPDLGQGLGRSERSPADLLEPAYPVEQSVRVDVQSAGCPVGLPVMLQPDANGRDEIPGMQPVVLDDRAEYLFHQRTQVR